MYFWNENFALAIACHAVYCLVIFFKEAHKDLAPTKPLLKFMVVKGIVFFTFFQNWCISVYFHIFPLSTSSPADMEVTVGALQVRGD